MVCWLSVTHSVRTLVPESGARLNVRQVHITQFNHLSLSLLQMHAHLDQTDNEAGRLNTVDARIFPKWTNPKQGGLGFRV